MKGLLFALDVFSESICQTVLPHLILSDAHSTSVGYSFPTAVANLCVTKDNFLLENILFTLSYQSNFLPIFA